METGNDLLRPIRRAGGRETKSVLAIPDEDGRFNNNNSKQMDTAINMTDIQIVSTTLDRNPKRLPRTSHSTHTDTTPADVERFRNDPLYHPGPYQQRSYQQTQYGVVMRGNRHEKDKRIARSEYMVKWRQSSDHMLSAKITDGTELTKPRKVEQFKDVERLIIEDDDRKMKEIPSSVSSLSKLSDFSMKYARIKAVPQWMATMTNILQLSITETHLAKLDIVCLMKQLKKLDVSMNRISSIPKQIQNLENLVDLKATGNSIAAVAGEIQQLPKLETLDLSSNKLQSLPNEICNLRNLRSLDASRNILEKLPEALGKLECLTYLVASHNRLSSLPGSIQNLRNLRHITVANNKLKVIQRGIEHLINLEHLNMRNNDISVIEEFPQFVKFVLLDMNSIKDIEIIAHKCEKLEVLSIKDNELTRIPRSMTENNRLKSLYIDGNPVENIPSEIGDNSQLRHLTLNKTKLRQLPENLTSGRGNRLSLLDVQDTKLSDDVIRSSTRGIEPDVVDNNLKRANRNSTPVKSSNDD